MRMKCQILTADKKAHLHAADASWPLHAFFEAKLHKETRLDWRNN